jgi:protocatechuate 3,4-dioxygenase alpha subunit
MIRPRTPSQTVGPFFGFALPWPEGPLVVAPDAPGAIRIAGRLLDGGGQPVPDGLIETWQADPEGRFASRSFRGFARCPTDRDGRYAIVTLKPGPARLSGGAMQAPQAPHLAVSVFARGLLKRAVTRIYFSDEEAANRVDPVLARISDAAARATLVAARLQGDDDNGGGAGYRFDIRLQGEGETVFFDLE